MEQQDVGAALHQWLLLTGLPDDEKGRRELQRHVCDFVDDRKAAGWPPERVIIAVKQIAREAGLRPSTAIASKYVTLTNQDNFLVELVGWCIHRYYASAN
jgi:hypothetical protein